jgi:hypothetical protein
MSRQVTPLAYQVDGQRFDAYYAVTSNMLTVWNPSLGSRSAEIGGAPLTPLIDTLFHELVREGLRQRRSCASARA